MSSDKSRVTLKTIANACGYSVNTVSRALRSDTRLPQQTIEKIQSIADELGYIRNGLASSLRSGKSNIIAILVDNIHNQHYSSLITHLDSILRKEGFDIIILCCNADDSLETHLINIVVSNAVDGVLFFPRTDSIHTVEPLIKNNIPFVLLDREITGLTADVVCCDDYAGGYLAGKKLCGLGHQNFLYLAGDDINGSQILREQGFKKALLEHGILPENIRSAPAAVISYEPAHDIIMNILDPIDYTAIFTFNDQIAYSVINSLRLEHYRIPEDISVIGFDNTRQEVSYLPPLTSVGCQSSHTMAETAVTLLLRRIHQPDLPYQKEILPVSIQDGGTAGACL